MTDASARQLHRACASQRTMSCRRSNVSETSRVSSTPNKEQASQHDTRAAQPDCPRRSAAPGCEGRTPALVERIQTGTASHLMYADDPEAFNTRCSPFCAPQRTVDDQHLKRHPRSVCETKQTRANGAEPPSGGSATPVSVHLASTTRLLRFGTCRPTSMTTAVGVACPGAVIRPDQVGGR